MIRDLPLRLTRGLAAGLGEMQAPVELVVLDDKVVGARNLEELFPHAVGHERRVVRQDLLLAKTKVVFVPFEELREDDLGHPAFAAGSDGGLHAGAVLGGVGGEILDGGLLEVLVERLGLVDADARGGGAAERERKVHARLRRTALVRLLGELSAQHPAEQSLFNLRQGVVIGCNHILVVARERDLLRFEVRVVGTPPHNMRVQHHQVVSIEEEGKKLYSAEIVDVHQLELGSCSGEIVELVRVAKVLLRARVEPEVEQSVEELRHNKQRLPRILEPDGATVEQGALLLILVESEQGVGILEGLRERASDLSEDANGEELLAEEEGDGARELLILLLLGLGAKERARGMPAEPLDGGLPPEGVGVHLEERLVVLDHHRLPDCRRQQVHVEQQRLGDALRMHLDTDAKRGDGGHVLGVGEGSGLLRGGGDVVALGGFLFLVLVLVLDEALDLRHLLRAILLVLVVEPLQHRRTRGVRHLAGGGAGSLLCSHLLLEGGGLGTRLFLGGLRRRLRRRLLLGSHLRLLAFAFLLLALLALELLLPLLLLQAHGLHHARVLSARDRAPARRLQVHDREVLFSLLALQVQFKAREVPARRVLQHDGTAAEQLRSLALHLVHDLALQEDHRLAETELLLRDLHVLHHTHAHRLRVPAARNLGTDARESADELVVFVARRIALTRHAHCLDHATATQLLHRLLVVEEVRLLLRVRVHAAHEMWVRRVDRLHERGEVRLERGRHGRVRDPPCATSAFAPGLGGSSSSIRLRGLEELDKELGLGRLKQHDNVVCENVLVLLAKFRHVVRDASGVVIHNERRIALFRRTKVRVGLHLGRLRELVEELLVISLGHKTHIVEAGLDTPALALNELDTPTVVDKI
mmetsp:Transcript_68386/g.142566  ORF Transcript_68386/g.142566 Transcript_68386/m.142566 type:complete len:871 (+) Transcript_68386:863-3475(+)